ncbi:hypothetical protein CEXT_358111 [Caerostris extrusa]|uniref:Uncharacterized protein n=1 Tax=Caerostris extrusa TaxID=172846 RepID=A0AAV4XS67_CAEEX|nr:hypothetical protein CEXT_358111 [Caerostris extrusa]
MCDPVIRKRCIIQRSQVINIVLFGWDLTAEANRTSTAEIDLLEHPIIKIIKKMNQYFYLSRADGHTPSGVDPSSPTRGRKPGMNDRDCIKGVGYEKECY